MKFENVKDLACYLIDNKEVWFKVDNGLCGFVNRRFRYVGSDNISVGLSLDWCVIKELTPLKKSFGKNSLGDEFFIGDETWFFNDVDMEVQTDIIDNSAYKVEAVDEYSESYKTKEQAEEMLERYIVEKAFEDGSVIEYLFCTTANNTWIDALKPKWKWDTTKYRVKEAQKAEVITHDDGTVTINGMHLSVKDGSLTIIK